MRLRRTRAKEHCNRNHRFPIFCVPYPVPVHHCVQFPCLDLMRSSQNVCRNLGTLTFYLERRRRSIGGIVHLRKLVWNFCKEVSNMYQVHVHLVCCLGASEQCCYKLRFPMNARPVLRVDEENGKTTSRIRLGRVQLMFFPTGHSFDSRETRHILTNQWADTKRLSRCPRVPTMAIATSSRSSASTVGCETNRSGANR